ncbi:hypothetical protein EVAR_39102_1 [Eumeta japonica]|uniref:Uncharacterized protein n=1 Tax=Eumeta variegata TaxID=151549 RepID=A0A4C1X5I7_EUMVA|nr:hypothetical protein EVAR_39102_1 [Eumeta japonica]
MENVLAQFYIINMWNLSGIALRSLASPVGVLIQQPTEERRKGRRPEEAPPARPAGSRFQERLKRETEK